MNSVFYDRVLEIEAQSELDLAHRVTELKACDLAIVLSCTVDRGIGICINGVIKEVEDVGSELQIEPLVHGKLLDDGQVGGQSPRPCERIATDVAQVSFCRIGKRATWICRDVRNRCVKRQVVMSRIDATRHAGME